MNIKMLNLFPLLSVCCEDRAKAKRLELLAKITQAPVYTKLSQDAAYQSIIGDVYSVENLETLDDDTLQQRLKALTALGKLQQSLSRALKFGNAHDLSVADLPDFSSASSIKSFQGKLSFPANKSNYTNLSEERIFDVFSDSTIKSAQECFEALPLSVTQNATITEEDIISNLPGKDFCVDSDEFGAIHSSFLSFTKNGEQLIKDEKLKRKKHFLFKTSVVMLVFLVCFTCNQYHLFSSSYSSTYGVLMFISALLYFVWG